MSKFEISEEIKDLNYNKIKNNLFKYRYDLRKLKDYFKNPREELEHLYSSFKGEVYENIIYELLLDYVKEKDEVKKFILKGPHQKRDTKNLKSGLLIDKKNQIVYKASYKDISEFDALFFTENEIYFVEMSTSKKTSSLNKRLFKKRALLQILFPKHEVKALIVLTKGSVGLKSFPSYCTIWVTEELNDDAFLKELSNKNSEFKKFIEYKDDKFVEANDIEHSNFKYYQTLKWILYMCRSNKRFSVDLSFFNTTNLNLYFDIYTKLYIGYVSFDEFIKIVPDFGELTIDDKVIVTIEKINQKKYDIVFYPKDVKNDLKRVYVDNDLIDIKLKESEGFTNAEVKFMLNILDKRYLLNLNDITHIRKNIEIINK